MIKKGSKVLIASLNKSMVGSYKLYPQSMDEYIGTVAIVLVRKTEDGNVAVKTEDNQTRIFLKSDLIDLNLTKKQQHEWTKYLKIRDIEQGEPYSWFSILTDEYGHKQGLERVLGIEPFTLDVDIYSDIIG